MAEMTLAEKAAQIAQVEKNSITPDEVMSHGIGSVLSGSGGNPEPNTPEDWRAMVERYLYAARQSRLGIPLLYGTDAVHGHSNVVGATIFPHNIGLGATGDPDLVERVHRATALETAATGARWAFAPTVAVALDPRWGRTYESFGADPALVSTLGAAAVRGLQGATPSDPNTTLACLKHFVGDGGTAWDSVSGTRADWIDWWDGWGETWRIDQGDTRVSEQTLRTTHLPPYQAGIEAGALSVMVSYSSWNGDKLHGHHRLLTEVLKGELGFSGIVISDWLGIAQLHPDPYRCVVAAITAGIDMVMVPFDYETFIADVVSAVQVGDLDGARLDDAVRRILAVKHHMGLFDPEGETGPGLEVVGSAAHRALAGEAVARSAVLLKDNRVALPLVQPPSLLVAGLGADDIGLQCGGWTIEWLGAAGPITTGTTILDGLKQQLPNTKIRYRTDGAFTPRETAPVGIAVVAEPPHAEGQGDRADLRLPDEDVALVERLYDHVDALILVVLSGRPLILDAVAGFCDAVVAAWLPGSQAAAIAELLDGSEKFTGCLPRSWPGFPDLDTGAKP